MVPLVYIIIVNYNGYKDTIECVNSIEDIDYSNYRIIVVDNGSTNNSLIKLESINSGICNVLSSRENLGFSGGNNLGIKYALENEADYILLLNNDTIVTKDFLRILVEDAEKLTEKAILTCKINYNYDREIIWYAGGSFSKVTSRTTHFSIGRTSSNINKLTEVSFISGCCMLIPNEIIKKVGLMPEEYFLYCEDLAYCCDIVDNNYKLFYEPNSLIYHKVNASTGSASYMLSYYTVRNKLYIIKKYCDFKIVAFLYIIFETLKRIFKLEYNLKGTWKGICHFLKGKNGKQ